MSSWFQTGRLADGSSWPSIIQPGSVGTAECYEADWSLVGCSGWVQYLLGGSGAPLYFSFSNPVAGTNGIDIGALPSVWNDMTGHYFPIGRGFQLDNGVWIAATICGSGGTTNEASWAVRICDTTTILPSNLELRNVQTVHANFPTAGTRCYYQCDDAPTGITGLVKSHFKGISSFADKLIFTHTNLFGIQQQNGKYLIADKVTNGDQGATNGTFNTPHTGLLHPCSSQACGSFMAMGIQADESGPGAKSSEIQILDIRMTQVNQQAVLLGTIPRPNDGVNGVAMTKESGADGKYLVAGVNGNNLAVYRSQSSSLITNGVPTVAFDEVLSISNFPDSGAGLALVTQQGDGAIFLFALNADDSGSNNQFNLYSLNLQSNPTTCTKLAEKDMQIPGMSESLILLGEYAIVVPAVSILLQTIGAPIMNSSFRWGKGLAITSPDTIDVYASDRNDLSLSHIPGIGSNKDFSVVRWASGQPLGEPVYLTTQGSDGIWTFDPLIQSTPTQIPTTAGLGFRSVVAVGNLFYLTTQGGDGIWTFDVATGNSPTQIASTAGLGFSGVTAIGNTLYLTTQGSDGIWTFDVVSQTTPTPIASTAGLGFGGITSIGNILYLTTQGSDGIWTFDIVSQGTPTQIPTTAGFGFRSLVSIGNAFYLTTHGSDGIWTFDVVSQTTPTPIASTAGLGFRGVISMGNTLYLTTQGSDGIWTFDIVSQSTPQQTPTTAGLGFRGIMSY